MQISDGQRAVFDMWVRGSFGEQLSVQKEADDCVRGVSGSSENSVFEVRPRRACRLAVCTGLESPRSSSVNSHCRCCGTE